MFRGQLVELKAVDPENLPTYVRWFQDPEVLRLLSGRPIIPYTLPGEKRALERMARGSEDSAHFAIHTVSDGQLIGNCSLMQIDGKNRSAELGIVIGERGYWGKGFGSDAMRVLLRFGFMELNLHRVWLRVLAFNERAVNAYRKLGFVEEGRLREAVFREGRYWDEVYMSLLLAEYRQSRSSQEAAATASAGGAAGA